MSFSPHYGDYENSRGYVAILISPLSDYARAMCSLDKVGVMKSY